MPLLPRAGHDRVRGLLLRQHVPQVGTVPSSVGVQKLIAPRLDPESVRVTERASRAVAR